MIQLKGNYFIGHHITLILCKDKFTHCLFRWYEFSVFQYSLVLLVFLRGRNDYYVHF